MFRRGFRHDELAAVMRLETVLEHGAVDLSEDVVADFDDVVRPNTEDVGIERSMVDLAHGQPIGHHWLAAFVKVRKDVCGVEQLHMTQIAH